MRKEACRPSTTRQQPYEIDPQDPQTCTASPSAKGDFEPAKKHFRRMLEIKAPQDLRGLTMNRLHGELRPQSYKAKGPRMGGSLLPGWALLIPQIISSVNNGTV